MTERDAKLLHHPEAATAGCSDGGKGAERRMQVSLAGRMDVRRTASRVVNVLPSLRSQATMPGRVELDALTAVARVADPHA